MLFEQLTQEAWSLSPLCFSYQSISSTGLEVWCSCLDAIRDRQQGKKDVARPQPSNRNQLRVQSSLHDNHCVKCVTRLTDFVCVSGKVESLNPPAVLVKKKRLVCDQQERDCKFTCKLLYCQIYSFWQRVSTKERSKSQL